MVTLWTRRRTEKRQYLVLIEALLLVERSHKQLVSLLYLGVSSYNHLRVVDGAQLHWGGELASLLLLL